MDYKFFEPFYLARFVVVVLFAGYFIYDVYDFLKRWQKLPSLLKKIIILRIIKLDYRIFWREFLWLLVLAIFALFLVILNYAVFVR